MDNNNTLFIKEYGVIFTKTKLGYFEPIFYNVKEDENGVWSGIEVKKGDIIYDYIMFVRYSAGNVDKKTGKKLMNGYLDIYQWIMSIYSITMALNFKSEDLMVAISRQAGKSHSSRLIIAFLVAFAPKYAKIEEERFYTTICSYKLEVVEELVNKLQERIKDAIDCFNMIYKDIKLEDKSTNQTLMLSKRKYEINAIINNQSVPWSSLDGLSLNNTVLNASYTSSLLVVDEAQDILESHFNTQAKPFSTRTGALTLAFGTSNEISESLLTSLYFSEAKSITKIIFTCEDVIKYKKLVSQKHAEKYETTVKNEIEKKGLHSSYIQSQYYCNFHMTNEKFISLEKLKDNNILIGSIETDIKHYTDKNIYRVGAIDPAISHDRAIFCYGTADITDRNSIITNLKDIVIMKEKNELTNSKIIAKRLADECLANNLDILVVDNTATQIHQTYEIANYFLEHGVKTQVIPQSFSGQEKMKMFSFMENSFYKQMAILPSLEYKNSHKGYKLLLEELFYLRKEKRQSGYTWSAPKGEEYTDDAVMAYLMFNYAMYDFLNRIKEREMITISTLKYFPTLRKYPTDSTPEQKTQRTSWLLC